MGIPPQPSPKPLTTLHVDLGRQWRGGQSQALLLVRGLLSQGHVAELVAPRGSPLAGRAQALGVRVHAVAPSRTAAALALRPLVRTARFDVVHCHDAHGLTAAWLAGAAKHTLLVASRRVAYPLSRSPLGLRRYRSARRIVAVSNFVRASVVQSGVPAGQVEVVYDGVEVPDPAPRRSDLRFLGSVGYLLPEKGQELLIRALPRVLERRPGCRLVLAGAGPCRPALERLAAELGVAHAVGFPGLVEDVAQVYRELDVFLFPSLAEPLGSSLLSAMAHGLPAVAVGRGAVPEVIEDGRNGLLVPAPEPDAFAHAVLRLLDDPALAARLGAAARQTIQLRFSVGAMVENTLQVYRRVLEGCPPLAAAPERAGGRAESRSPVT
jgi:glycosyltransferase involved in cell wall biosynthesis